MSKLHCPKCKSLDLIMVRVESLKMVMYCKSCGFQFRRSLTKALLATKTKGETP